MLCSITALSMSSGPAPRLRDFFLGATLRSYYGEGPDEILSSVDETVNPQKSREPGTLDLQAFRASRAFFIW